MDEQQRLLKEFTGRDPRGRCVYLEAPGRRPGHLVGEKLVQRQQQVLAQHVLRLRRLGDRRVNSRED